MFLRLTLILGPEGVYAFKRQLSHPRKKGNIPPFTSSERYKEMVYSYILPQRCWHCHVGDKEEMVQERIYREETHSSSMHHMLP